MQQPRLSIVLATDTYVTIRPVIERLRKQTVRDQLELVLISPSAENLREVEQFRNEFANLQILEHPFHNLGSPRAVGIRASTAPFVFIQETHTFANPEFAEAILEAMSGGWDTATPCFVNANPEDGLLSWAAYLTDYGPWNKGMPGGQIQHAPIHNTAYQRDFLMQFGDRMGDTITRDDDLWASLRASGKKSCLAPRARLEHANVSKPRDWVKERFCVGLQVASQRVQRWPLSKRLLYLCASPLIPFVLTKRMYAGFRETSRHDRIPMLAFPVVFFGTCIWVLGEVAGYLGKSGRYADYWMFEYEVRKLAYTRRGLA